MSINELFDKLQAFRIDSVLDMRTQSVKTKHFIITENGKGTFSVNEKDVEAEFLVTRIIATEILKRNESAKNKPLSKIETK